MTSYLRPPLEPEVDGAVERDDDDNGDDELYDGGDDDVDRLPVSVAPRVLADVDVGDPQGVGKVDEALHLERREGLVIPR